MSRLDERGRPEPHPATGEVETLLGFLDYQRATLAWKCSGLGADGMRAKLVPSAVTLGGLLKHLAWVEYFWFSWTLHEHDESPPWDKVNWNADPDWPWESAAADSPDELRQLWEHWVQRSRTLVAEALATGGLDQLAKRTWSNGEAPSLRWILVHMIEEYARHNGHADFLRESFDGETGD